MNKLTKLELKRIPLRPYVFASKIIVVSMIAFTYLFAIVFRFGAGNELELFNNYNNIITFTSLLGSLCFAVLSAVMYSKFIIEEYTGKGAVLLFSYPVNRIKVLYAKIKIVSIFTFLTAAISNIIIFALFFTTEFFVPLIADTITLGTIFQMLMQTISFALIASGAGILSMQIGFWKKSGIATVVASLIISSIISQIFSATLGFAIVSLIFAILFLVASVLVVANLSRKIAYLEVC